MAIAVAWLIADQLHHAAETRTEIKLAACLSDKMAPDLPAKGEFLIDKACEQAVRVGADTSTARCVLRQRDKLVSDDAAEAVGRQCGLTVP